MLKNWGKTSLSLISLPRILENCRNYRLHGRSTTNTSFSIYGEKFYATKPVPKKLDWERVVSDAERLVGYQTSFLNLRWLLSDEVANLAVHLRRLVGRNHPLLKTAKFMLYNEKSAMQVWGLVVLLLSKAAGYSMNISEADQDKNCGVLYSQRALAEVTEMIRVSHLVHNSLVNLQSKPKNESGDIIFGNKISLLTGDYLLGHSSLELANLRNQTLTGLISSAIRDFTESEFIGDRDNQNNPLPSRPKAGNIQITEEAKNDIESDFLEPDILKPLDISQYLGYPEKEWELRHLLHAGHLLARSCQGALHLAQQSEKLQTYGFLFGKHLSLAWQACLDFAPFRSSTLPSNSTFNLIGAPVLFHLNYDASCYDEIEKGKNFIEDIDFVKLHSIIKLGPSLKLTKDLQFKHTTKALQILENFPQNEARTSLENILVAMQDL